MKNFEIKNEDFYIQLATEWGSKLIGFLLIIIAAFIVAGWVKSLVYRSFKKSNVDDSLGLFFAKISKYAVLTMGVVTALGVFGVQTASFAAVLASVGFAIGLALQGTLSHFAAGVMILFFKPFKVGQVIKLPAVSGTVAEIDLFSTMLDTPDKRRIIVPNGTVYSSIIENVSYHDIRRVDVIVGTDYTAGIEQTRDVLLKAAKGLEFTLDDPEPAAVFDNLGDSSVTWVVRIWVNTADYWPAKEQLTVAIKNELDAAKIGIPFPQMELNLPKQFLPK